MSTVTGNPGPLPVDPATVADNARAAVDRVIALLERAEAERDAAIERAEKAERERDEAIRQRDEWAKADGEGASALQTLAAIRAALDRAFPATDSVGWPALCGSWSHTGERCTRPAGHVGDCSAITPDGVQTWMGP